MKTLIFSLFLTFNLFAKDTPKIVVGSKPNTENVILAEMIAQAIETTGEAQVERKFRIGETAILLDHLKKDTIDIYVDYSGNIADLLISAAWDKKLPKIRGALANLGIITSGNLGFNTAPTLVVKKDNPKFKNVNSISDLKRISSFKGGFSYKFLSAQRGVFPLFKEYGITQKRVRKLGHKSMITKINSGEVEVIEMAPTNSDLFKYNLKALDDDRKFLPQYLAFMLAKKDFPIKFPASWKIISEVMVNKVTSAEMAKMNAKVDLEGKSYSAIAAGFLKTSGVDTSFSMWKQIYPKLLTHLQLVLIPLLFSTIIGVFLVSMAAKNKVVDMLVSQINRFYKPIPFVIALCLLIPFLGTGKLPVYITLFIFGIFPIVKYSFPGRGIHQILTGIKNTAFINVGMATLAAYVGAGGLGDLIISGLSGKDKNMILMGVIPAIILVALIHLLIEASDKYTTSKGLRR